MKNNTIIYVVTYDGYKSTNPIGNETPIDAGNRLCREWAVTTFHIADTETRVDRQYRRGTNECVCGSTF